LEIPGKKDVLQYSTGPLAELLHSTKETQYLTETCVQLCRCASELPAFRFTFAKHVLSSIWLLQKVYGVTSIAAIYGLMADSDPNIRIQAVHACRHFLTEPPVRGDEIRVPPVCPLERIDNPRMFAIEECTGILHNLLFLLGEEMPQDAQGPALDCLEELTKEVKAKQELLEVLQSGERPVAEYLLETVEAMCAIVEEEPPQEEEAPQDEASGPTVGDVLSYRAEGQLLKLEIKEIVSGSSLCNGSFEWENNEAQEEYLVTGNYEADEGCLKMLIGTVHHRSVGQEDFQEEEVMGAGVITATFVGGSEETLEIGSSEQWPDAQSIQLQKDH